jgi:membrane associated rhomboid family serine protease
MIPLSDDNPTLRTPLVTLALLAALGAVWVMVQGAGLSELPLAESICRYGMIPAALTGHVAVGSSVPLGGGLSCPVMATAVASPLTSMFMHGGWGHLLGNCLFLWVFGNNVEDSMGRMRFIVFYLLCGLAAAGLHVVLDPASAIPTVGASGAISGVMGAYLVLYPRVRVNMLFIIIIFIRIIPLPAWVVLIWWFVLQVFMGLPQLTQANANATGGVAVWAHVGGFIAGVVLVKLFENRVRVAERDRWRHRWHPDHP